MARVNPFSFLLRPYPTYYIVFVTARCNARCPHCFYSKQIAAAQESRELTLTEYRAISSGMGKLKAVAITGGEPSLRNDVVDICGIFAGVNKVEYLTFHTNGLLVEKLKDISQELLRRLPDTFIKFELSIDGLHEEHDRLRNSPGLFLKNIELVEYLASQKKSYKNFGIGLNTVYSSANSASIADIYAYCRRLPVDSYNVNFLRGDVADPGLKKVSIEGFMRAVEQLQGYTEVSGTALPLASFLGVVKDMRWQAIAKIVRSEKMPFHCVAGRKMLVIAEDGMVYPCELLGRSFGNLRDHGYDMRAILSLKKTREILADIRAKRCFCTWECAITNSIIHDPARYPEMLYRWLAERACR